MTSEFELIRRYFSGVGPEREDVDVDIGDDAAVVSVAADSSIVMALDVLVEGVHFPVGTSADRVACKALTVNLSDLAAMGAKPSWFTLGLSLVAPDEQWVALFAKSLAQSAKEHGIRLIGGDTTRGPLTIAINACGIVKQGTAIERRGACAGDQLFLTGDVGGAALGLGSYTGELNFEPRQQEAVRDRLDRPTPRVAFGQRLVGLATSAIDVSDGLAQDLNHLLDASGVGASVHLNRIPLHPVYRQMLDEIGYQRAVGFGDDYELLFTAPAEAAAAIRTVAAECDTEVTMIGIIEKKKNLRLIGDDGESWSGSRLGHDHFRTPP